MFTTTKLWLFNQPLFELITLTYDLASFSLQLDPTTLNFFHMLCLQIFEASLISNILHFIWDSIGMYLFNPLDNNHELIIY
jgi:hypothetical protein